MCIKKLKSEKNIKDTDDGAKSLDCTIYSIDVEFVNNRDIKYHECPYCVYSTHMIIF